LNYKRAKRLIPQDVDLKANLEYAQSTVEQPVARRLSLPMRIAVNFINDMSMDTLTRFSAIVYLLMFLLAAALLFIKTLHRPLRLIFTISVVIFIFSAAGLFMKINQANQPWAIVLDREVEARYEPFESATAYFKLFQGQEVLALNVKGGWVFIKRPDGKSGWVKAASVENI
jgi:hypothetical protein